MCETGMNSTMVSLGISLSSGGLTRTTTLKFDYRPPPVVVVVVIALYVVMLPTIL